MSVVFREDDKKIELSIVNYEFPWQKGMDSFDADWLTVKIDYEDAEHSAVYTDNCLLASELESMVDSIKNVIDGKETGIIMDFLEPYLNFSLTKIDDLYAIQIRFVYDTIENWKEIYVSQGMSIAELKILHEELNALSEKFPHRNVD